MTSSEGMDEPRLESLPDETHILILRHLHFCDLVRISQVCRRFRRLVQDDALWRWQCQHNYLEDTCSSDQSWRDYFIELYKDFGHYPDYKEIKQAWNQIEDFLEKRCPSILDSLNGVIGIVRLPAYYPEGVSEDTLDAFERRTEEKLPPDFRASYRIHNGQLRHTCAESSGLMGGGMVSSHLRSDELLPFDMVGQTYLTTGYIAGCVMLTKDQIGHSMQLLAVSNRGGFSPGQGSENTTGYIAGCVMLTKDQIGHSMQLLAVSNRGGFSPGKVYDVTCVEYSSTAVDCFVLAKSYKDWLCSYAERLSQDNYYITQEYIIKFYQEPSCVATTNGITVRPYTCFIPELSSISPPHEQYFFAYRIIIEMSDDAPEELSSRLETRHWVITDADDKVTNVNGPGVVGEYPEMRPGKNFAWISCCTFDTPSGSMRGHFTFRNLQDGTLTDVECPSYHMEALPTLKASERQEIVKQLELREPDSD